MQKLLLTLLASLALAAAPASRAEHIGSFHDSDRPGQLQTIANMTMAAVDPNALELLTYGISLSQEPDSPEANAVGDKILNDLVNEGEAIDLDPGTTVKVHNIKKLKKSDTNIAASVADITYQSQHYLMLVFSNTF